MLLVKNAKVVDGLGGPLRQADVLVSGSAISAIGHFPHKKADTVIDGLGMYLCPGFIEPAAHADHTLDLFKNPAQESCRKQGITTLVGGNDSASLAPIIDGSLEGIAPWGNPHAINVNWHTVKEFTRAIHNLPLGVNFGTLAGYETVRRVIANAPHHDLTDNEWRVAEHVLERALREGALGISAHLAPRKGAGASPRELKGIAEICAREGKPLALHAHPNDGEYMNLANRALTLYKATGVTIILKDFAPRKASATQEKEFLLAYDAVKNAGDNFYLELSFAENELVPLKSLVPEGITFKNPSHRKQILKSLPRIPHARIKEAPRPYERLIDMTLEEYALRRGTTLKEAICALMECTNFQAVLEVPQEGEPALTKELIEHPRTLVAGSPQTFFKSAHRARWPIEKAVARLTAQTARAYGIQKRGAVTEYATADLVIMDTRSEITRVIVNGSTAKNAGICIKH